MNYSFDIDYANKYGVDEAIMIANFQYWIMKNKACERHLHEGRTWTYNSAKSFAKLFPFWKEDKVRRVIESLKKQNVIITGNYNQNAYDRTLWYAFYDESIFLFSSIDSAKMQNGSDESAEPIPYNKPDVKPSSKQDIETASPSISKPNSKQDDFALENVEKGRKRIKDKISRRDFVKPTLEEVRAYCKTYPSVNPEQFYNFYDAADWHDSNGKDVKSWKQKVITWAGRGNKNIKDSFISRPMSQDPTFMND